MLVIVETRCIRTLRRTVLIPCIIPMYFLLSALHTGRLNLILQRRPTTKRTEILAILNRIQRKGTRGAMTPIIFQFYREHKDIFITTPILEGTRLLSCEYSLGC